MIFEFRALLMGRQRYGVSVSLFVDCQDKSSDITMASLSTRSSMDEAICFCHNPFCPSRKKYFRNGRGFSLHLTHSRICAEFLRQNWNKGINMSTRRTESSIQPPIPSVIKITIKNAICYCHYPLCPTRKKYFRQGRSFTMHLEHSRPCRTFWEKNRHQVMDQAKQESEPIPITTTTTNTLTVPPLHTPRPIHVPSEAPNTTSIATRPAVKTDTIRYCHNPRCPSRKKHFYYGRSFTHHLNHSPACYDAWCEAMNERLTGTIPRVDPSPTTQPVPNVIHNSALPSSERMSGDDMSSIGISSSRHRSEQSTPARRFDSNKIHACHALQPQERNKNNPTTMMTQSPNAGTPHGHHHNTTDSDKNTETTSISSEACVLAMTTT